MIEVRSHTVGPVQENCYLVSPQGSGEAVIVDPGDEPERLLAAVEASGVQVKAILLTHCHFDHIGAVAPVAAATGAEVWVPTLERHILADINTYMRIPGFGPFESYEAEHAVGGDEVLELAGMTFDVRFAPGHSVGHVVYSVRGEGVLLGGDVLFQQSIGRTDLPGGDLGTLLESIQKLLNEFPPATQVLPGHMGPTTLGAEVASNPFLQQLTQ